MRTSEVASDAPPAAEAAFDEPEILIVDGDASMRPALEEIVRPFARALSTATGKAAIEIAADRDLAAVLVDLQLPDMDAYALVKALRSGTNAVPVLFLCDELPDWLSERRGYALGALGYATKPVDPHALRAKLEVLVTLWRRGAELRKRERMIAEQHEAIREAHAQLERASTANRTKDMYMGVLGHDLRNPLSAIIMSSRMLLMDEGLSDIHRDAINRIARNGERMAALIRDILDYTRGQSGGIPIVAKLVDMHDICSAMIEEMALLHSDRTIRLQVERGLDGEWDRGRVEQVLSNLLSNALQHARGPITVTGFNEGEVVVLSVHNDGTIPAQLLPTLFEPFRRGSSSRMGLGLGLYIVREIMRAHGGTVEVRSAEGEGTTFTTRWPRKAAAQAQMSVEA